VPTRTKVADENNGSSVAWLLLVAIVVLSLVPPDYRPVTPLPHDVEHVGIFFATGLTFGLGYESRRTLQAIALVLFAALIEVGQLGISGRHARLSDFAVDAGSVCIASGLAAVVVRAKAKMARNQSPVR
jgi:VanZ family protein